MNIAADARQSFHASRNVPRWAVITAHLIPVLVLPSAVWRIVLGFGIPMGADPADLAADGMPGWGTVQMLILSLASECAALLSLVLVQRWGEVTPSWLPILGGRRIPPLAIIGPAVLSSIGLTWMWVYAFAGLFSMDAIQGTGWRLLMYSVYVPTLLWGPLLLVLAGSYWVRRRDRAYNTADRGGAPLRAATVPPHHHDDRDSQSHERRRPTTRPHSTVVPDFSERSG